MTSNLKWDMHRYRIHYTKSDESLTANNVTLHDAPEKIKLLAYSTLCKPILEYALEVWHPSSKQLEQQIDSVQRKAVRFNKNLKL